MTQLLSFHSQSITIKPCPTKWDMLYESNNTIVLCHKSIIHSQYLRFFFFFLYYYYYYYLNSRNALDSYHVFQHKYHGSYPGPGACLAMTSSSVTADEPLVQW